MGKIRSDQTDMARIWDWIEDALNSHTKERTKVDIPQMYLKPVGQQRVMKEKHTLGGISIQDNSKIKMDRSTRLYHEDCFSERGKSKVRPNDCRFNYRQYLTNKRTRSTSLSAGVLQTAQRLLSQQNEPLRCCKEPASCFTDNSSHVDTKKKTYLFSVLSAFHSVQG